MKALILDVGNSRCKIFAWAGEHQRSVPGPGHPELLECLEIWDTPGDPQKNQDLVTGVQNLMAGSGGAPLVLTSVVPEITHHLSNSISNIKLVDHSSHFPFRNAVDDEVAVGADRFCNVAAAAAAGVKSALIVDVGTATTFDVLLDGVFLGGLIAPGPEFAMQKLAERAPRLQAVPFQPASLMAATSTRQALAAGSWHCGVGGIESCIRGLLEHHGTMPVFLTGGLGQHLDCPGRWYDPHLTLRGAAVLAGLV